MTGAEEANVAVPGTHYDDPEKTKHALSLLETAGRSLLVRGYLVYRGGDQPRRPRPSI